ncbi:uncharacterized protein LY89DRAFT_742796 [Mollisia scopiformis]|uniref:2EXR domain-containing protein n=1 Tax=Mollisia scopiformis TaxID=149040 RepID=A0A132B7A8_MOLSC|nr:uncharacterized protein LY89DRAFT_742796 [Mollisia scopiformis]KUJ07567.1 hypothetical protein LY89DRAFT_742796 [Mollisia scopiformis]
MQDPQPNPRAPHRWSPQHEQDPSVAEILSSPPQLQVNVFYQRKTRTSFCMSNCKNIEVAELWPLYADHYPSHDGHSDSDAGVMESASQERLKDEKRADQEPEIVSDSGTNLSLTATTTSHDPSTTTKPFPFFNLPLELRLKIYALLLPPRHHKITTQIPHNGYFYNTSTVPLHSATSFYPFGTSSPPKLTTYKVLTANFRSDFPSPSIEPQILRTCKKIKEEAEWVLYGGRGVVFDFETSVDAAVAFWGDRSREARGWVRGLRVAREVPSWLGKDSWGNDRRDEVWDRFCRFVKDELTGLWKLDVTLWSSSGSAVGFPSQIASSGTGDEEGDTKLKEQEDQRKWREWEYTASLLQAEGLREARVTWWGFGSGEEKGVEELQMDGTMMRVRPERFDSWVARRMVGDRLVREKMVRDGVVVEGVVVVRGSGA